MGAFRDFFEGLFEKISDPIGTLTSAVKEAKGFLGAIKTKFESIDEVLEKHVTGPLVEAIENTGGLPAKLLVSIESLVAFLDSQKDNVVEFFSDFKGDIKNKAIAFHIERMQVAKCVSALDDIYGAYPSVVKDYPGITEYYNTRKAELEGEGMVTFADLGLNIVGKGIVEGVNSVTRNALANLMPVFEQYLDPNQTNPEPKEAIEKIAASGEFGLNAVVAFMLGHFLSPVLSTSMAPAWEGMGQQAWKALPVQLMDVQRLINLMHRFPDSARDWTNELRKHGLSDAVIQDFKDEYKFYPSPNDLVTWLAREVYEPDAVSKYGLGDEWNEEEMAPPFLKAGVDSKQAQNFWKAHWQHPSFTQIREMLHRGLLHPNDAKPDWSSMDSINTWEKEMEKEVYEWYRLIEVPPHWRDKLTEMSYNVPTRVDVRRWWDLKTITEERLRELYHNMGYHGKDLEDYVLWTKIYVLSKDLRARYSKGYLTKEGVSTELTEAGMDAARVTEWTEAIVKATGDERIKKEKDLTKAEICKGVKKGVITRDVGRGYLERLGYDEWEARFILNINVEHLTGSPGTNWEFEELVNEYQNALGARHKEVSKVLIELEKEYRADPKNKELEKEYRQAMKEYYEE